MSGPVFTTMITYTRRVRIQGLPQVKDVTWKVLQEATTEDVGAYLLHEGTGKIVRVPGDWIVPS